MINGSWFMVHGSSTSEAAEPSARFMVNDAWFMVIRMRPKMGKELHNNKEQVQNKG